MTPERIRLMKMCRCRSTSSGPRVIIRDRKPEYVDDTQAIEVVADLVEFACEACDTPWKRIEP